MHRDYDTCVFVGTQNAPQIFMKFYDPDNDCLGKCRTVDHGGAIAGVLVDGRELFAIPIEDAGWQARAEAPSGGRFVPRQIMKCPNSLPA